MRTASGFAVLALALILGAQALGADYRLTSRMPWAFACCIDRSERVGNTLYLAGTFNAVAPVDNLATRLVALQTTGTATPAGPLPGADDSVNVLIADGGGGYFAGGFFQHIGGLTRGALAHVRADGSVDPVFAPALIGIGDQVPGVSVLGLAGNVLYVSGSFSQANGVPRNRAAVLDAVTGAVLPWNPPLVPASSAALAVSGGTIFIASGSTLAAFDAASGTPLPGFSAVANGTIAAVVVSGPTVYLGGGFTAVNGSTRPGLAAVDTSTGALRPLALGVGAGEGISALAIDGVTLYMLGPFQSFGGLPRSGMAAVDVAAGVVTPFNPAAVSGRLRTILAHGGSVFLGGLFSRIGDEPRANIAALDPSGTVLPWNPGLNGRVDSLVGSGGAVAAGGLFTHFGAVTRDGLAAVDLVSGALTGLAPHIVRAGNSVALVEALDIVGTTLYLGGDFTSVDGVERRNLAALDLRSGTVLPWNPAADGDVWTIVASGNAIYVGGDFSTIAGTSRNRLAALHAVTGADLGWDAGVTGTTVLDAALVGSTLYVGGSFSQLGGQPRSNLGAFDLTTGGITAFNPGVSGPSSSVYRVKATATQLFLAGPFASVGGQPRTSAAAVDRATGTVASFAPVVTGPVWDIDVIDGRAFLVGELETVNGVPRAVIAAVDAATGLVTDPFDVSPGSEPGFGTHVRAEPDLLVVGAHDVHALLTQGAVYPASLMDGAPGRPSVPVPIVTGGTAIAMHWRPSPLGGEPTSFVVEAGTSPGALNLGTLPTSTPTFSFAGVPPGRYFLRVRAVNAFGSSPPSSEIAVTFGSVACGSIPQQVTARSVVSGNTVTITWPDPVGVNGTYALIAGTRLGASDIATLPTGATRRFVTDAPPGVYYVRVATDSACGQGAVGPDIEIAVAGALPLPAPSITAQVTGDTVMITWQAVPGAIGYRLDAGNGPLRANAATVTTASTSVVAQGVPPGTYYLRVRARLAGGAETEASNELVIMVR